MGEVVEIRATKGLASGLPGTTGAWPDAAFEKNPARESNLRLACRFLSSGPWQGKHFSFRIGWTPRTKPTGAGFCAAPGFLSRGDAYEIPTRRIDKIPAIPTNKSIHRDDLTFIIDAPMIMDFTSLGASTPSSCYNISRESPAESLCTMDRPAMFRFILECGRSIPLSVADLPMSGSETARA